MSAWKSYATIELEARCIDSKSFGQVFRTSLLKSSIDHLEFLVSGYFHKTTS